MIDGMLGQPEPSPAERRFERFGISGPLLEQLFAVLLALTIVLVAAGSAWRKDVKADASGLRWLSLLALCGVSVLLAVECCRRAAVTALEHQGALLGSSLLGLCFVSTAWSVDPRLTFERAASVAMVVVITVAAGFSAARRPELVMLAVRAILVAIGILIVASLVLLLVDSSAALQPSIVRFRGVEENPDTLPLLAAYGLPLAAWRVVSGNATAERYAAGIGGIAVLIVLGASGSRGGLLAALVGLLVFAGSVLGMRVRTAAVGAAVVFVLLGTLAITPFVARLPGAQGYDHRRAFTSSAPGAPLTTTTATIPAATTVPTATATTPAATTTVSTALSRKEALLIGFYPYPMQDELGRPATGVFSPPARNLLSSSGRLTAWAGAIHQADQRPLLGFGFGTEDRVFIDRYFNFAGARPENSFVGLYLQLGIAGVVVLVATLGWVALAGLRTLRGLPPERRGAVAALAGVVAAGAAEMLVQSFAFSAGDIAMLSFWVCAGLLATSSEWAAV
jgi:hypothetical protein